MTFSDVTPTDPDPTDHVGFIVPVCWRAIERKENLNGFLRYWLAYQ
jgi:hypothetical protein